MMLQRSVQLRNLFELASWEYDGEHEEVGNLRTEATKLRELPPTWVKIIKVRNGCETFHGILVKIQYFWVTKSMWTNKSYEIITEVPQGMCVLYSQNVELENQIF